MDFQPNLFRYHLTLDAVRTELIFAPEGWDEETIGQWMRDTYYNGLIRSLSLPIRFVFDGYDICKAGLFKYGYEAEVRFEVEKLNRKTFIYESYFVGDLDFSEYKDNGEVFEVVLADSGPGKEIKSAENVKYEYPLTGADVVNIVLPGVAFSEQGQFITPQQTENITNDYIPAMGLVNNETNSGYVTLQNTQNIQDPDFATSTSWFAKANRAISVNVKGTILGNVFRQPLATSTNFFFSLRNQTGAVIYTFGNVLLTTSDLTKPFNFTVDTNISLANNDRLFLYVTKSNGSGGSSPNWATFSTDGQLDISYSSVSDPSNCKGIKGLDLFKRIVSKIAPTAVVDSSLMRSQWANLIFTSGTAIREIADATIQISFKDFYDTFNGLEDAAFGLDAGIARIEQSPYFYRPKLIYDFGEVKECEFSLAAERLGNSVKIGYDDGNTDEKNGRYEYNSTSIYKLPVSNVKKELDYISPVRADQYGIENLRVNFITKKSVDNNSDNDTFMVDCNFPDVNGNYNPILGSSYVSVSGMPSFEAGQSSYNLALTPKNNLLRKQGYFRSILDKLDPRYIQFASAEKNAELITVKGGIISPLIKVSEKESVQVSSLNGKYFLPHIADINVKLPRNMMEIMDKQPFGYFAFTFKEEKYYGYMEEIDIDLAKNNNRNVKLLLCDGPLIGVQPTPPVIVSP